MKANHAFRVLKPSDSTHRRGEAASSALRACVGSSGAINSGVGRDAVLPPTQRPLTLRKPVSVQEASDGDRVERAADEAMRARWRGFWCCGYRNLAAADPALYPPTVRGYQRAIEVLTTSIQSIVDDSNPVSDAWPSSADRSSARLAAFRRERVVSVRRARPSPATLARWLRDDRGRSEPPIRSGGPVPSRGFCDVGA